VTEKHGQSTVQTPGQDRAIRKTVVGVVTSDKMEKTIAVTVYRLEKHKKYQKFLKRRSRFYAHDEKREAKIGDRVLIQETRPLSKLKRWRLLKILEKAGG
jgi:small subunit ribosomal protein S17